MTQQTIVAALRDYFVTEVLEGDTGLTASTPLLEYGVLNSLEIRRLVAFVEKHFGVAVPGDQVIAENLQDLNAIGRLIARLKSAAA
jgi:acyl carrier protein